MCKSAWGLEEPHTKLHCIGIRAEKLQSVRGGRKLQPRADCSGCEAQCEPAAVGGAVGLVEGGAADEEVDEGVVEGEGGEDGTRGGRQVEFTVGDVSDDHLAPA